MFCKRVQYFIKRIMDVLISIIVLIVLSPFLIIVALLIKITSPGPIFFVQERIGKGGKPFRLIKFRTMVKDAERITRGVHIDNTNPYITKVGRFLRKWSIDEIPELINVLKGEMSLVGPRPTLAYQVKKYSDFQKRRLLVKPGLTGWAQVNGRNAIPWEERIKLDIWYIDHWSLWLDIVILFKTLKVLFRGDEAPLKKDNIVRVEDNEL